MGVIFQMWTKAPVYHLPGKLVWGGTTTEYTLCGREIDTSRSWMPLRHLLKFARLCKDCERHAEL